MSPALRKSHGCRFGPVLMIAYFKHFVKLPLTFPLPSDTTRHDMTSNRAGVIVRFDEASFHYIQDKPILDEASFSVRENAKITIMGQNGAGKSTIFKLITGEVKPERGSVHLELGSTIAIATQVMKRENLEKTVETFFADVFEKKTYDLPNPIKNILHILNLISPL